MIPILMDMVLQLSNIVLQLMNRRKSRGNKEKRKKWGHSNRKLRNKNEKLMRPSKDRWMNFERKRNRKQKRHKFELNLIRKLGKSFWPSRRQNIENPLLIHIKDVMKLSQRRRNWLELKRKMPKGWKIRSRSILIRQGQIVNLRRRNEKTRLISLILSQ